MMDNLRTAANSVVLKIIFGIIIVSFILTGVSGYLIGGGKNYAAKVNGQEIGRGQFENAVASERNRMQQQLGDQFSELVLNPVAQVKFVHTVASGYVTGAMFILGISAWYMLLIAVL